MTQEELRQAIAVVIWMIKNQRVASRVTQVPQGEELMSVSSGSYDPNEATIYLNSKALNFSPTSGQGDFAGNYFVLSVNGNDVSRVNKDGIGNSYSYVKAESYKVTVGNFEYQIS